MALDPVLRMAILLRDGCACVYCGSTEPLEVDHVEPSARNGSSLPGNLVTACHDCNHTKGVIHVEAFFLHRKLLKCPRVAGQAKRLAAALAKPVGIREMARAYEALYGA